MLGSPDRLAAEQIRVPNVAWSAVRSYAGVVGRCDCSALLGVDRPLHDDDVVPIGVAHHEHQRGPGWLHGLGVEVDVADRLEARVLAADVGRLDLG